MTLALSQTFYIREIKHRVFFLKLFTLERLSIVFTADGKREFVPRDQVSSLLVVYCSYNYTKIGRFMPILSIRIVLSCFYLLISHFENFST